jgi:hypothetical protein
MTVMASVPCHCATHGHRAGASSIACFAKYGHWTFCFYARDFAYGQIAEPHLRIAFVVGGSHVIPPPVLKILTGALSAQFSSSIPITALLASRSRARTCLKRIHAAARPALDPGGASSRTPLLYPNRPSNSTRQKRTARVRCSHMPRVCSVSAASGHA